MKCNLSSVIEPTSGSHYFRVQATNEHNKSCLSKDIRVDPLVTSKEIFFLKFFHFSANLYLMLHELL